MENVGVKTIDEQRNVTLNRHRDHRPKLIGLHHHTTIEAAISILSENQLRLSHAAFCNDLTELKYGLKIMREVAVQQQAEIVFDDISQASDLMLYGAQP